MAKDEPITAASAFAEWRVAGGKELADEVDRLIEKGEIGIIGVTPEDETPPDFIVAGPWPHPRPGSRRESCSYCAAYVSMSPEGQAAMARSPNVKLLCGSCALNFGSLDVRKMLATFGGTNDKS